MYGIAQRSTLVQTNAHTFINIHTHTHTHTHTLTPTPVGRNYTESCDVFSFGVVVWEIVTRRRPTLGAGKGQHSNMAILYAMANGEGEKYIM